MRVKDHPCTRDIPDDTSCHYCADIPVEIREKTNVDRKVDDEEDEEVLDDTIVSDFFEQENVGDECGDRDPIEEMARVREGGDMRDISDDQDHDEDDIEELEDTLGSLRHL